MNNAQPSYEFLGGNDALGGESVDIYLLNLGGGLDIIDDTADIDILRIGAGILPTDITLVRSGMDLVLGINGTDDQLIFQNWGGKRIERVEFADGTVWHAAYLQLQITAANTGTTSTGTGQAPDDDCQAI